MNWAPVLIQIAILALVFACVHVYRKRAQSKPARQVQRSCRDGQELQKLARMRAHKLNTPLSEMTRPQTFSDIIGQEEGIRALRAALCGPNPQHVIIYGPPGIGKTCAARLVLEEAKQSRLSPFDEHSQFVEVDATCVRFDERAIADPLIGSVHDPIYQGAGAMGAQGIPQPKPGAVTKAHCGVLFLDEIGELHPMQMNKLLKVLEDRCVHFESAYYAPDNTSIPQYIHDIFQHGLPADFRLVGATTRQPEELPPALRSRCMELYFKPLGSKELERLAAGAAARAGYALESAACACCALHAGSGRDAVNIVQLSCGLAYAAGRTQVEEADVMWVARNCNYKPRMEMTLPRMPLVGHANGLAVAGSNQGVLLEIACLAAPCKEGGLSINGMIEEEELTMRERKLRRKSMALSSVENVLAALEQGCGYACSEFALSISVPGGVPVDGPSAGLPLAIAIVSAMTKRPPASHIASTGEVTMLGDVRPVGGVREKIEAALYAGASRVLIPEANWEDGFAALGIEVIPVRSLQQALCHAFPSCCDRQQRAPAAVAAVAASPV